MFFESLAHVKMLAIHMACVERIKHKHSKQYKTSLNAINGEILQFLSRKMQDY